MMLSFYKKFSLKLRKLKIKFISTDTKTTKFKGLQFKISREEAIKIITKNTGIFEKTSNPKITIALTIYKGNLIEEKFVPFHSANITGLETSFHGEYGIDRWETYTYYAYDAALKMVVPKTSVRVVTDWYSTSGGLNKIDYPFGYKKTQIYAGFKYPRKYIEYVLANEENMNIIIKTKE